MAGELRALLCAFLEHEVVRSTVVHQLGFIKDAIDIQTKLCSAPSLAIAKAIVKEALIVIDQELMPVLRERPDAIHFDHWKTVNQFQCMELYYRTSDPFKPLREIYMALPELFPDDLLYLNDADYLQYFETPLTERSFTDVISVVCEHHQRLDVAVNKYIRVVDTRKPNLDHVKSKVELIRKFQAYQREIGMEHIAVNTIAWSIIEDMARAIGQTWRCYGCDAPWCKNAGYEPLLCEQCVDVSYCSEFCQKKHWKAEHKKVCMPSPEVQEIPSSEIEERMPVGTIDEMVAFIAKQLN